MKKKVLSMALVSTFAVVTLASCNKGSTVSIPEVNVLSYDEIKDKQITISFWHSFGAEPTKALTAQVEAFQKEYPNIKVNLESKGGYDNLKKAVTMEIPTGNTPDVVLGYPDHFAEYLAGGIQVPLDEYMNSTDPEIGIGEGAHDAKNDFFDNYMVENRQYVDNLTFGLPFNKSTELAFYNKTVFDEFGIEVPTTWQELETTAQSLKDKVAPYYGKVYTNKETGVTLDFTNVTADNLRPISYDSMANAFITLVRDYGGTYTEVGESFEEGFIKFDSQETRNALNMVKSMGDKNLLGIPQSWEVQYCSDVFKNLQSFYTIGSSAGSYHNLPDGDKFEVAAAPIPYYSENGKEVKSVIQQGTNIAMLANNTDEERMAAWLLIRYLTAFQDEETGYDPNAEFAIGASYLPVRQSGVESKVYSEFLAAADSPDLTSKDRIIIAAAKKATEYDSSWNKFTDPAFIGSSTVRATAETIIPSIIVAKQDIDTVIKNAYNQLPAYQ